MQRGREGAQTVWGGDAGKGGPTLREDEGLAVAGTRQAPSAPLSLTPGPCCSLAGPSQQ